MKYLFISLAVANLLVFGCSSKANLRKTTPFTRTAPEHSVLHESSKPSGGFPVSFEGAESRVIEDRLLINPNSTRDSGKNGSSDQSEVGTAKYSGNDPFGLIPPGWPDDIDFHPEEKIAESGVYAMTGLYLIALVSPEKATCAGVQNFHIEHLASWQNLQVRELPIGPGQTYVFAIIAENPGIILEITTQVAEAGFISTLKNSEYWIREVTSRPIKVMFFCRPRPR